MLRHSCLLCLLFSDLRARSFSFFLQQQEQQWNNETLHVEANILFSWRRRHGQGSQHNSITSRGCMPGIELELEGRHLTFGYRAPWLEAYREVGGQFPPRDFEKMSYLPTAWNSGTYCTSRIGLR
ncbi:hypothetical protein B0T26DRAFT_720498 [Lasiosphaeria miniovina]|uniref:Secreted protein n=1 Tax=Lasiosphaeria miniovina TaxID=1954250 RepID=A0AA40A4H2_9PEZI|nr:uncharacterized protein B0T26DRAFT_720498 [Lasiosphaeria miniovina]KAK0709124.1 hypothetical protein B0T26DRAFT_720498 [Lasiosphaeria miniovina]